MDENKDNQIVEEQLEQETIQEETAEEPKKEYRDPNEEWFSLKGNTGDTRGNYNYEYHSSGNQTQSPYNGYNQSVNQMDMGPLSMGEWLLTILIGMVPCLGTVVYCVWAFGSSGNVNRRNYCRAFLIMQLISIGLAVLFAIVTTFFSILTFGLF